MQITQVNDDRTDITNGKKKARIERGPRRITAKATKELLDDSQTASHYFAGERDASPGDVSLGDGKPQKVIGRDANGKPIKIGEEMVYIDWVNRRGNSVWYVYLHDDTRFNRAGEHEAYDVALTDAINLVA